MPAGTGFISLSRTYTCTLSKGLPMGSEPSSSESWVKLAQIVVSVGPYTLNIRRPLLQRTTRSLGQGAPPVSRILNPGSSTWHRGENGRRQSCVCHALVLEQL